MAETNTALIDVKGGNNLLYLPIDKMMPHQSSTATLPPTSSQPSTSDQPQSSQPVVVQDQAVERPSIRSRETRDANDTQ